MNEGAYEQGMRISFDKVSRHITIAFRGKIRTIPTILDSEDDVRLAAEAWCRTQGWIPSPAEAAIGSLLAHGKTSWSHL